MGKAEGETAGYAYRSYHPHSPIPPFSSLPPDLDWAQTHPLFIRSAACPVPCGCRGLEV